MFQQGVTLKQLLENPDLLNPPKQTEQVPNPEKKLKDGAGSGPSAFVGQSAFLGPNIWDKTVPYTDDFNLEYMDLDEFLLENGVAEDHNGMGGSVQGSVGSPSMPNQMSPQMPGQMSPNQMSPQMSGPETPRGLSMSPLQPPLPSAPLSPPHHSPQQQQQHSPPMVMTPPMSTPKTSPPPVMPPPHSPHAPQQHMGGELARYLSPSPSQGPPPTSPQPSQAPTPQHQQHSVMSRGMRQTSSCLDDDDDDDDDDSCSSIINPNSLALVQVPGQEDFDPRKRAFSEDELRPQPMIKKSRKVYVPDDMKDDKYWARRKKNNTAAKRSRDARRVKENQIALRAAFLEKQMNHLSDELKIAREENAQLRKRLEKYEGKA